MIQSVYHLLQESANSYRGQVAAKFRQDDRWVELTWGELERQVHALASGLIELGIQRGDRVAILSKTRVEWSIADLAISAVGACTVPIYHSSTQADIAHIVNDSGSKVLFVEDSQLLQKVRGAKSLMPEFVIVIGIDASIRANKKRAEFSWTEIFDESVKHEEEIKTRVAHIGHDDLASIVYTSGTTGEPKGAMLTHDNLMYEARAIEKLGLVTPDDVQLLFLPLAHVFAKVMQIAWLKTAHLLFFAESPEKVVENMKDAKPTFMAAVPRVYEKVHAKIVQTAQDAPFLKRMIAQWAFKQGDAATVKQKMHESPSGLAWNLAQRLVFKSVKERLNETFGGRLRFFISGGAPLSADIAYFFKHAGVMILEGYGLTETSAATCVNLPSNVRIGTVGKAVPGSEIKIASDGEILIRGRGVFKGYWKRPEATQECLIDGGWFCTGDVGVLDQAGFLKITGRKKEIIVTAGGKKVAPQKVENLVTANIPMIENVVVYGDKRPYLVALFVLDAANLIAWQSGKRETIRREIRHELKAVNELLPPHEQIKRFDVIDHAFEIGQQLTPTMKVKRNLVIQTYRGKIEALYG